MDTKTASRITPPCWYKLAVAVAAVFLLSLAGLISFAPLTAYAAGNTGLPDVSWYNPTDDYFEISTADQLAGLSEIVCGFGVGVYIICDEFDGKTIKLTADIDLSVYGINHKWGTYNWDGSKYVWVENPTGIGWKPIGYSGYNNPHYTGNPAVFKGTFDGGGHKITGLYVDTHSYTEGNFNIYAGLFGYVWNYPTGGLKNITLVDVDVTGEHHVGGLVGHIGNILTVDNCSVSGTVKGSGNYVGGLVGSIDNDASVINSRSSATVSGDEWDIGGLVGSMAVLSPSTGSIIENCYATGDVSGRGEVGGLVGDFAGTMTNCYAAGDVSGWNNVGGLAGRNSGDISNSYATGAVTGILAQNALNNWVGNDNIGGLVGLNNVGSVQNCAALNPSVAAIDGKTTNGRVAGAISGGNLSGNIALDSMKLTQDGVAVVRNDQPDLDGESKTGTELVSDKNNTLSKLFTAANGWTYAPAAMPILTGLAGQSDVLPPHIFGILTQPTDEEVTEKEKASFSITAAGGVTPYAYQWEVSSDDGLTWENVESIYASYSTTAALEMDGFQYRCIATSANGYTAVSDAATLTVNPAPPPPPIINDNYIPPDMTSYHGYKPKAEADPDDVPSDWAAAAVEKALKLGLIPEQLQGKWRDKLTRAEFCALAVKLYEYLDGKEITARAYFDDTDDVNVQKLAGLGIVKGDGNGKFDPDGAFTREMALTLMYNMMIQLGYTFDDAEPSFADGDSISPWAKAAIGALQKAGVVEGDGQYFNPTLIFTREMGVVTIMNFPEKLQ